MAHLGVPEAAHDVLDVDQAVVDHDAQSQDQAAEGHGVQAEAEQPQGRDRQHQRQRHAQERDYRRPCVPQRDQHQHQRQPRADGEVDEHAPHRRGDHRVGAVETRRHHHALGLKGRPQLVQRALGGPRLLDRARAILRLDRQHHAGAAHHQGVADLGRGGVHHV